MTWLVHGNLGSVYRRGKRRARKGRSSGETKERLKNSIWGDKSAVEERDRRSTPYYVQSVTTLIINILCNTVIPEIAEILCSLQFEFVLSYFIFLFYFFVFFVLRYQCQCLCLCPLHAMPCSWLISLFIRTSYSRARFYIFYYICTHMKLPINR